MNSYGFLLPHDKDRLKIIENGLMALDQMVTPAATRRKVSLIIEKLNMQGTYPRWMKLFEGCKNEL